MEQQNPYRLPNQVAAVDTRWTRWSRDPLVWFCLGYYTLAILWGAHSAVVTQGSATDLVLQFTLPLVLGMWAVADARQRQKPIPHSQQLWFYLLAWLVVPGYVIITRGWKGLGWVVFHAVGWIAFSTLSMQVTGWLYFGEAWWRAMGFVD